MGMLKRSIGRRRGNDLFRFLANGIDGDGGLDVSGPNLYSAFHAAPRSM